MSSDAGAGDHTGTPKAVQPRTLHVGPLSSPRLRRDRVHWSCCCTASPDGPETFREQVDGLAKAGFHAVAVTLRGYEESSRPPDAFRQVFWPRLSA